MNKLLVLTGLMLAAAPIQARPILKPISKAELANYLPKSAELEVRIDADVTGDGIRDTVAVGRSEEERKLVVLAGYVYETDMGYRPVGSMAMDISPLGEAGLSVKAGVLIVQDLTGGTTAINSLYRFRFEKPADRMRLIGDDVTLYSRTNAHGSTDISTNRLTGVQITKHSKIRGEGENASLIPGKAVTRKISSKPIYMEDAPDPAVTLGWGD